MVRRGTRDRKSRGRGMEGRSEGDFLGSNHTSSFLGPTHSFFTSHHYGAGQAGAGGVATGRRRTGRGRGGR